MDWALATLVLLFFIDVYCAERVIGCARADCPRCHAVHDNWLVVLDTVHDLINIGE